MKTTKTKKSISLNYEFDKSYQEYNLNGVRTINTFGIRLTQNVLDQDAAHHLSVYADTIVLSGDLKYPGRNILLHARKIMLENNCVINTSVTDEDIKVKNWTSPDEELNPFVHAESFAEQNERLNVCRQEIIFDEIYDKISNELSDLDFRKENYLIREQGEGKKIPVKEAELYVALINQIICVPDLYKRLEKYLKTGDVPNEVLEKISTMAQEAEYLRMAYLSAEGRARVLLNRAVLDAIFPGLLPDKIARWQDFLPGMGALNGRDGISELDKKWKGPASMDGTNGWHGMAGSNGLDGGNVTIVAETLEKGAFRLSFHTGGSRGGRGQNGGNGGSGYKHPQREERLWESGGARSHESDPRSYFRLEDVYDHTSGFFSSKITFNRAKATEWLRKAFGDLDKGGNAASGGNAGAPGSGGNGGDVLIALVHNTFSGSDFIIHASAGKGAEVASAGYAGAMGKSSAINGVFISIAKDNEINPDKATFEGIYRENNSKNGANTAYATDGKCGTFSLIGLQYSELYSGRWHLNAVPVNETLVEERFDWKRRKDWASATDYLKSRELFKGGIAGYKLWLRLGAVAANEMMPANAGVVTVAAPVSLEKITVKTDRSFPEAIGDVSYAAIETIVESRWLKSIRFSTDQVLMTLAEAKRLYVSGNLKKVRELLTWLKHILPSEDRGTDIAETDIVKKFLWFAASIPSATKYRTSEFGSTFFNDVFALSDSIDVREVLQQEGNSRYLSGMVSLFYNHCGLIKELARTYEEDVKVIKGLYTESNMDFVVLRYAGNYTNVLLNFMDSGADYAGNTLYYAPTLTLKKYLAATDDLLKCGNAIEREYKKWYYEFTENKEELEKLSKSQKETIDLAGSINTYYEFALQKKTDAAGQLHRYTSLLHLKRQDIENKLQEYQRSAHETLNARQAMSMLNFAAQTILISTGNTGAAQGVNFLFRSAPGLINSIHHQEPDPMQLESIKNAITESGVSLKAIEARMNGNIQTVNTSQTIVASPVPEPPANDLPPSAGTEHPRLLLKDIVNVENLLGESGGLNDDEYRFAARYAGGGVPHVNARPVSEEELKAILNNTEDTGRTQPATAKSGVEESGITDDEKLKTKSRVDYKQLGLVLIPMVEAATDMVKVSEAMENLQNEVGGEALKVAIRTGTYNELIDKFASYAPKEAGMFKSAIAEYTQLATQKNLLQLEYYAQHLRAAEAYTKKALLAGESGRIKELSARLGDDRIRERMLYWKSLYDYYRDIIFDSIYIAYKAYCYVTLSNFPLIGERQLKEQSGEIPVMPPEDGLNILREFERTFSNQNMTSLEVLKNKIGSALLRHEEQASAFLSKTDTNISWQNVPRVIFRKADYPHQFEQLMRGQDTLFTISPEHPEFKNRYGLSFDSVSVVLGGLTSANHKMMIRVQCGGLIRNRNRNGEIVSYISKTHDGAYCYEAVPKKEDDGSGTLVYEDKKYHYKQLEMLNMSPGYAPLSPCADWTIGFISSDLYNQSVNISDIDEVVFLFHIKSKILTTRHV